VAEGNAPPRCVIWGDPYRRFESFPPSAMRAHSDDRDQSFQRIATSVTRVTRFPARQYNAFPERAPRWLPHRLRIVNKGAKLACLAAYRQHMSAGLTKSATTPAK
jgi:hypothetical protein